MSQSWSRFLKNRSGKTRHPGLAVVILFAIVVVQGYFLWRAYGPVATATTKKAKVSKSAIAVPSFPWPASSQSRSPSTRPSGRIAVIIDDSGYNRSDCEHLAAIAAPVTISILPQLRFSEEIAECANALHKEVMLHLPLEPYSNSEKYPESYIIKTTMPKAAVIKRFYQALKGVPFTVGVNNHMGSKATENTKLMSILFAELAKSDLFFVDSRVTGKSVCLSLARKYKIPFTQRDIFLDNTNEREYIEGQFRQLAQRARSHGVAVGIGHARPLTWTILKEQAETLTQEGFQFVTVRGIINQ
jgi:polysaccharide deacetylase 2 family uncharacterized protein YibQ